MMRFGIPKTHRAEYILVGSGGAGPIPLREQYSYSN